MIDVVTLGEGHARVAAADAATAPPCGKRKWGSPISQGTKRTRDGTWPGVKYTVPELRFRTLHIDDDDDNL
jgi:hypothetical protein